MKNDFNLKKKINIIGSKIFTNFGQKIHNFRLNHHLQDLWILTNTGVALYHREFDNSIRDQLFAGLMSALNDFTESLVEGSISSFETSNTRFNLLKKQDLLFVSNSSKGHKEKEVIKALETIAEKFTQKFDAIFFKTWDMNVSIFAKFEEEITDQIEEKASILKNQRKIIENKPHIYNLRHKTSNFKQKLNKDNFQKIKKTRSFKILTYALVQAAIIGIIFGTQLAIFNMTGDVRASADFDADESIIIEGGIVQFIFNGSDDDGPLEFIWDFGDGSPLTSERNPTHQYITSGNYTVSLTVIDINGVIDSIEKEAFITVIEDILPQVDFHGDITSVISGEYVQFTFNGSVGNEPTDFVWNFGDGSPLVSERNPRHRYDALGIYDVSLIVFDADDDVDFENKFDYITVLEDLSPRADFENNISTILQGEAIQFTFNGTEGNYPTIFSWDFGDGSTSIERNPVHDFNSTGIFNVSLMVSDADGDVDTNERVGLITVIENLSPEVNFIVNESIIIEGESVKFLFTGNEGNSPSLYTWDFGDGLTSNEKNPSHQYVSPGNYNVSLTIIDFDNQNVMLTKVEFISVLNDLDPDADFEANITSIIEGQDVYFLFEGDEGNDPAIFVWDFGDGQTSTEKEPIHKYDTFGFYNISLTVMDHNGDIDVKNKINYITVIKDLFPDADFKVNTTELLEGDSVKFTYNGSEGNDLISFNWDFGDGFTSTSEDPTHSFNIAGVYDVSLTVIDIDGDIDSELKLDFIVVSEDILPNAEFNVNITSIIQGEYIKFTFIGSEGNNPATYLWNFGDGFISTEINPIHLYDTPGIYNVSLLVTDNDKDSDFNEKINFISVIADLTPDVDFKANITIVLEGDSIQFTFNGTEGNGLATYLWNFGDGVTSTEINPVHQYDTPGMYNVSLTIIDQDGDKDLEEKINFIIINVDLIPDVDFSANLTTIFEGEFIQFTFNGTEGNGQATYLWDFGDGTTSIEKNPIHQFNISGIYNITLEITDFDGDKDVEIKIEIISVLEDIQPNADFVADITSITAGESIQFTFIGITGNDPADFLWNFGDGSTSTDKNPIHQFDTPGIYNVSLRIIDLNGDIDLENKIDFITVIEDLIPIADFKTNITSIFEGEFIQFTFNGSEGNNPVTFEWNFGDGFTSTDINPIHRYNTPGNFSVSLKIIDGDSDISIETKYNLIEVIEDLEPIADFHVNKTKVVLGEEVFFNFNGTEGNGPMTYYWEFGDGFTSTEKNPMHQYFKTGKFNVSLTITDSDGDVSIEFKEQYIVVNYVKLPFYDLIMFLLAIVGCMALVIYILHNYYDNIKFGHIHRKYKKKRRREKKRHEKKLRRKHAKYKKKKRKRKR